MITLLSSLKWVKIRNNEDMLIKKNLAEALEELKAYKRWETELWDAKDLFKYT